jgi:Flp pilus assembly pilin Flp
VDYRYSRAIDVKNIWKGTNAEKGATVVEYVVLVALIIAVLIISIAIFGDQVMETYNHTDTKLTDVGL